MKLNYKLAIGLTLLLFSCKKSKLSAVKSASNDKQKDSNCIPSYYQMTKDIALKIDGDTPCAKNSRTKAKGVLPTPDYGRYYQIETKDVDGQSEIIADTKKGDVKLSEFYLAGSTGELKNQMTGDIKKFLDQYADKDKARGRKALTFRGYKGNFMKTGAHDITCGYTGTKSSYPLWMPVEAEYIAGMPSFDKNYCGACMKFELDTGKEKRNITLLYGDNLYQYSYGSSKKHMDISNAAFAYLKYGNELETKSVEWTNLHNLKIDGDKTLKVTFSRCDWGNKKMMYASKHGEIINIRRAPYAIGKVRMKVTNSKAECNNEDGYEKASRRNAESWNISAFKKNYKGKYVCLKMWPYKYEDNEKCSFIDAVNIENGAKSSMDGLNDPSSWTCTN